MMGVTSRPWAEFKSAVEKSVSGARVVIAEPGAVIDALTGEMTRQPVAVKAA
jgi:hypothetical protein